MRKWMKFLANFPKFGGKVQKIFQTQPLNLDQILFHFVLFTMKFFTYHKYYGDKSVWLILQILYFNFKLLTCHIDKY
jgi:hypothetical protein